ncbi:hypothetical protein OAF58_00850 [bacterium]|nr:hypothetical protein [bacterium]
MSSPLGQTADALCFPGGFLLNKGAFVLLDSIGSLRNCAASCPVMLWKHGIDTWKPIQKQVGRSWGI